MAAVCETDDNGVELGDSTASARGPLLGGTMVTLEHRVLGVVSDEDASCYTSGWAETLASLGRHAEQR